MTKLKKIDGKSIKEMRVVLQEAVKQVEKDYGVAIHFGNASYTPDVEFTIKTKVSLTNASGEVANRETEDFKQYAKLFDLKPEWLGESFFSNGKEYEITGLAMRSHKYPVLAKNTLTGKIFKFPASKIKDALAKSKLD